MTFILSIMNRTRQKLLQQLVNRVPPGFLVDTPWLNRHGIGPKSVYAYAKSGWLERLAHGVYRRSGVGQPAFVNWDILLLSLHQIMGYRAHVGGLSALEFQERLDPKALRDCTQFWLYGDNLPAWLNHIPVNGSLEIRRRSLFDDSELGLEGGSAGEGCADVWNWSSRSSSSERAILEIMDEVPHAVTFGQLEKVFRISIGYRHMLVNPLLQSCRKIRVRRLFCVFAERGNFLWWDKIDLDALDLGRGVHRASPNGRIHPRFKLIVPEEYAKP